MTNCIQKPSAALPSEPNDGRTRKLCVVCHGDADMIGPTFGVRIHCTHCEGTGIRQPIDVIPLTPVRLFFGCGHTIGRAYVSQSQMTMDRANARYAICRQCELTKQGASEWTEEEIFFDRVRGRREQFRIVDTKWGPEGCSNPTMFYRFVEIKH